MHTKLVPPEVTLCVGLRRITCKKIERRKAKAIFDYYYYYYHVNKINE